MPSVGYTTTRSYKCASSISFSFKPGEFVPGDWQYEKRLRDPSLFSLEKKIVKGESNFVYNYLMVAMEKIEPHSDLRFTVMKGNRHKL